MNSFDNEQCEEYVDPYLNLSEEDREELEKWFDTIESSEEGEE